MAPHTTICKMSLAFFVIILSISCSKDSDLFDSQISEQIESVRQFERGTQDMGELLAFPGAMGFGRNTTGGRGGRVIHVTNLNDSGPGSLREALETSGPRIIVFDVGGDIKLESELRIGSNNYANATAKENLTIAGETAPYPGITITGGYLDIHSSNVIVRYISVRPGQNANDYADGIRILNWGADGYIQQNIVIDHCSISHGIDENMSIGSRIPEGINYVTISNNILGKPQGDLDNEHKYNFLKTSYTYNVSIVQNYFAPSEYRNPLIGANAKDDFSTLEVINNISYGSQASFDIAWGNIVDGIANLYKPFSNGFRFDVITFAAQGYDGYNEGEGNIFIDENIVLPPFQEGKSPYNEGINQFNNSQRVITNSTIDSWETSREGIENIVLNDAGNSLFRDELDTKLINEYYTEKGDLNPIPLPLKISSSHSASYDTDNDGMADEWEIITYGTLAKKASDDQNSDGYTNIEEFFYSLTNE